MSNLLIFCESYGQVEHTLSLVSQNYHKRAITIVIPSFHDLFILFQVFNEKVFSNSLTIVYCEPYQNLPRAIRAKGIKKIFRFIRDVVRERRYLQEVWNKYFTELSGCEVFFMSRGFSGLRYYLLKKLSKKNRLVYIVPKGPPYMIRYRPVNIIELAKLIIYKSVYSIDITLGEVPSITRGFPWIPDKFINKSVVRVIGDAERNEMVRDFDYSQFKMFPTGGYRVIYFDDSPIESGFIQNPRIYRQELGSIFGVLAKYFPESEIAYKYHPGYSGDTNLIEIGEMLPSYIPAELLYDDNVQIYMSIFSWSIAHVENGLAISIANLLTFENDKIKDAMKADLIKVSKSAILFPESLGEFEQILVDLKNQKTSE